MKVNYVYIFRNFRANEPNGGTRENCVAISGFSSLWFDRPCYNRYQFICKKEAKIDLKL
jgi:hypothetical protein